MVSTKIALVLDPQQGHTAISNRKIYEKLEVELSALE
jgi:hypothetical protein